MKEPCPDGINVFWDNVGGEILEAALNRLALHGRVVFCGRISSYTDPNLAAGPRNYTNILIRRARVEGFLVTDYIEQMPQALAELAPLFRSDKLKTREDIREGLDSAPTAFVDQRARLGRRRGDALLPDLSSQPPRGEPGRRRGPPRRAVGPRHRRLTESGYFHAKLAQEKLIQGSSIPYSIPHATQFFEFIDAIADEATAGNTVTVPPALIQPIAADDVASALAQIAIAPPVNGIVEIAGPEQFHLDELIRGALTARNDPREVITDPHARYYGIAVSERTLLPGDHARFGDTRFDDWRQNAQAPHRGPHSVTEGSHA